MDDYKKKYLKYKNKYFELIKKNTISGGSVTDSEIVKWIQIRYENDNKFIYKNSNAILNIMKEECKEVDLENLNNNLLGFLFFLDSWHDFFQGRAKKDIRDSPNFKKFPNPDIKNILTKKTDGTPIDELVDKKDTINKYLQSVFPGRHNQDKTWKNYMSKSIGSEDIVSIGSFERSIENFIETQDCFNYIGDGGEQGRGIENAEVIQINLDYLKKLYEGEENIEEKIQNIMDEGSKILIFEYDESVKNYFRSIKKFKGKPDKIQNLVTKEDESQVAEKIMQKIRQPLRKFLSLPEADGFTVGIDAGMGQLGTFFHNELSTNKNNKDIKKLITPQIKGDSAGSSEDTDWNSKINSEIYNFKLNGEKVWELKSTVGTSPHFIRWFYKIDENVASNKLKFKMLVTPSSNITKIEGTENEGKITYPVWSADFGENLSRGLSVQELSFLIEQTDHSKDYENFKDRMDSFFRIFSPKINGIYSPGSIFDIKEILINLFRWGILHLGDNNDTFWNKPKVLSNPDGTTTPPPDPATYSLPALTLNKEKLHNVKRFIILFLLDYKRAGDYEQVYSALSLEKTTPNISTTIDIIAGLVYRILKIPLYSQRGPYRDLIFSTGKTIDFSDYINKFKENIETNLKKLLDGIEIMSELYIDPSIYANVNYHDFVKNNIMLLDNLFNYLKDKNIKEEIEKIFSNSQYIEFSDDKIEFKEELKNLIGANETNLNEGENNEPMRKQIKNDFNTIKNKLNKLSYLKTYIENWKDEKNDNKKYPSLANFVGLAVNKFAVPGKKSGDIKYYIDELKKCLSIHLHKKYIKKPDQNCYNSTFFTPLRLSPIEFYDEWHTENGITNGKKEIIRISKGEVKPGYNINYWEKLPNKDGRGWTNDKKKLLGDPPIEEKGKKSGTLSGKSFTANTKYHKVNLLWNGGTIEGPGLQQQCINILDKNLILFKAAKDIFSENISDEIIKYLNDSKTFLNSLTISQKWGFWRDAYVWEEEYNPIFTTHFEDKKIIKYQKKDAEAVSVLTNFTETIEKIETDSDEHGNIFKNKEDSIVDFVKYRTYLTNPTEKPGEKVDFNKPDPLAAPNVPDPIKVDFWFEAIFIDDENTIETSNQLDSIEEILKTNFNKITAEVPNERRSWTTMSSTFLQGGDKLIKNRNLNFKIDSHIKTNNNMIGGDIAYSWFDTSNRGVGYEFLKDKMANEIVNKMESFIDTKINVCEVEDHEYKINIAYSHLDNIVSNALLYLIYYALDDNPLQDMIDLNLIFESPYDFYNEYTSSEMEVDNDEVGNEVTKQFFEDYIKPIKGSGHSRKTNKDLQDEFIEKQEELNYDYLKFKINEYLKNTMDSNLKLLYYLTKFTTNYDEINKKNNNTFINKLLNIFQKKEIKNPLYVVQQFVLEFYINLSKKMIQTSENLNVLVSKQVAISEIKIDKILNPTVL